MATTTDGLSTAEVASRLGVDPTTVRNMRRDGRLKGYRPTGRGPFRFAETEVTRFQIDTGQLDTTQLAEPAAA